MNHTYEITLYYSVKYCEVVEYESEMRLVSSDRPIEELLKQHGDLEAVCKKESTGEYLEFCGDYIGDEYSEVEEVQTL